MMGCCLVGVSLVQLNEGYGGGGGRGGNTFIVFGGWLVDNGTVF